MTEPVSGMPAPQLGDESSWMWGSELVQGSSGSCVSFGLMWYPVRCPRIPQVEDRCSGQLTQHAVGWLCAPSACRIELIRSHARHVDSACSSRVGVAVYVKREVANPRTDGRQQIFHHLVLATLAIFVALERHKVYDPCLATLAIFVALERHKVYDPCLAIL
jgi:hypothetical protein